MAVAVSAAEWTGRAGERGNSSPWMRKPARIRVAATGAVAWRFHSTARTGGRLRPTQGTGEPFQRLAGASPGLLRPTQGTGGEPFPVQPSP